MFTTHFNQSQFARCPTIGGHALPHLHVEALDFPAVELLFGNCHAAYILTTPLLLQSLPSVIFSQAAQTNRTSTGLEPHGVEPVESRLAAELLFAK